MRYQHVALAGFGYTLPEEIVTSDELERRLEPLYQRLRLPAGRLELMTGIRERRFWPRDTLPSGPSVASCNAALANTGVAREDIGLLVHASVCRDHLEPATASPVHHALGLNDDCLVYDVSNACLGLLDGMVQAANMIELGQIRAALIVGTEDCRPLVETTVAELNRNTGLSREEMKLAVASLTIGSASCAVVLRRCETGERANRLHCATARAYTAHHRLCHSGRDEAAGDGMKPLMTTDSDRLLQEGVKAAIPTFTAFLEESGWSRNQLTRTFHHQVGVAHRRLLYEALDLNTANDFATVEFLGNTGSVAAPITMAMGVERGVVKPGDRVGLLGIGSGINVLILGIEWAG